MYDAGADWETKFLNYAKVIVRYHRETSGGTGKFLSDTDYEPIKGIMLESIPANIERGFRSKLASILAYAYELCIFLGVDRYIICKSIKDDFNLIQKLETAKQELPN
ncbi:hypothetical protein [Paenibacillus sp. FSL H8-0283]|uniref:hypothetical protein n=1 Tax=Paenibacillus sp. FSL H8-0283 TaxID=2921383 RepID=UPI0032447756